MSEEQPKHTEEQVPPTEAPIIKEIEQEVVREEVKETVDSPNINTENQVTLTETQQQIREKFLDQKIAICISLDKKDVAGFKEPNPYYVH